MTAARYVMIGGFLGAGKTTAISRYASWLTGQGERVGLITNDQSVGLVDSAMLEAGGFPLEEITGGCFCCRFNSLVEASERLTRSTRPDVFIAEPVGSCTDLRATVSYPLSKIYGDQFQVAPLSVLVDPLRALRVLGLETGRAFSRKVIYIYRKQLEEAEGIVINKCDLLEPDRLAALQTALAGEFAGRQFVVSAREQTGLTEWFDWIAAQTLTEAPPPDVDYELYAAGEALLGWYNATVRLESQSAFCGNQLLRELAETIAGALAEAGQLIAHLKMTLSPDAFGGDIGVLNLARADGDVELSFSLKETLDAGALIINLRAEGDPETARQIVRDALGGLAVTAAIEHEEHFRPGKPEPTHRMSGR